jgi:hypothetical protein
MERGHHAAKIVDAMREAHSKGIGLPTKMSEALADAVADNKDLDRNLRRIFKSQKAWLPAKPSVKPPVKPRKLTNAETIGGAVAGHVRKMPRWKKGLVGAGLAAAGAAGVYGATRP